ncbi:MAG: LLM class F420-dependent oxidoreductase [Candidatus Tectimicrobiota bacterium]
MRFGLFTSTTGISWPQLQSLWQHIEATGWDAACVTDHFMPNTRDPIEDTLECWTALSGLALSTQRMRIGTLVVGNTYRHPAVVAKMATTVDIMSGGRLICGLGGAWQRNEHTAYGIPFYTVGERLKRLEEACQVILRLWHEPKTTFHGQYYQLTEAPLFPKPVQQPHPELLIGGGGEQKTLRIVAQYADHWNVWGGPETLRHKGAVLDKHCAALGRDATTITRSANMPMAITEHREEQERLVRGLMQRFGRSEAEARDTVLTGSVAQMQNKLGRMRDVGVQQIYIPTFVPTWNIEQLDRFITEVAPAVR